MKTSIIVTALLLLLNNSFMHAQSNAVESSSTTLPGDNLNLNGVLNVFKESSSVQNFEIQLNDQTSKLNNLDLNKDGKVDYLRVHEKGSKKNHHLIIQAVLGEKDIQDVAVINITKKGDALARVQIVGDEALYGKNYIIEPKLETVASNDSTAAITNTNAGTTQITTNNYITNNNYQSTPGGFYNAWYWPSVSIMFAPAYVCWQSPFFWGYYPVWWNRCAPMMYGTYVGYWGHRNYYGSYCRGSYVACRSYRGYWRNNRTCSGYVLHNGGHNFHQGYAMGRNNGNWSRANWAGYGGFRNNRGGLRNTRNMNSGASMQGYHHAGNQNHYSGNSNGARISNYRSADHNGGGGGMRYGGGNYGGGHYGGGGGHYGGGGHGRH